MASSLLKYLQNDGTIVNKYKINVQILEITKKTGFYLTSSGWNKDF